jgi:N-acetylglucosaminyldiphosphoundecaprenol N-acetyl-beta-D-mannosaminyltransferase
MIRKFSVLGVEVTDLTMADAVELLERLIVDEGDRTHSVYFVNAHTLNTATDDPAYRDVLRRGDYVFGDGTGVRWATRFLHGERLQGNVNGTDLTPRFFVETGGKGYRYYLLGTRPDSIPRSADYTRRAFHGWELVGYHHGYVQEPEASAKVIADINACKPHLLLVGMGNPLQERWIDRHKHELRVPVCMAVGGLFDYWSGELDRAPAWVRAVGYEWLHLLVRQPRKARRYLVGNPLFLARLAKAKAFDRG